MIKPKAPSYAVPISSGLLEPKHSVLTNCPLGLFAFLINKTTKEVNGEGCVLGGAPMTYDYISKHMGLPVNNLKRFKKKLESWGYIRTVRTNHYGAMKWFVTNNYKKFNKKGPNMLSTRLRSSSDSVLESVLESSSDLMLDLPTWTGKQTISSSNMVLPIRE